MLTRVTFYHQIVEAAKSGLAVFERFDAHWRKDSPCPRQDRFIRARPQSRHAFAARTNRRYWSERPFFVARMAWTQKHVRPLSRRGPPLTYPRCSTPSTVWPERVQSRLVSPQVTLQKEDGHSTPKIDRLNFDWDHPNDSFCRDAGHTTLAIG